MCVNCILMIVFDTVIGLLFGLLVGWFCTRSPLWLTKFIDRNVIGDPNGPFHLRRYPEFAAYIRKYPESWHLRYPLLFRAIRLTGWLALTIVGVLLIMVFLVPIRITQ